MNATYAGSGATAPGYLIRQADHQRRLRRIEGQGGGITRMVDKEAYCIDASPRCPLLPRPSKQSPSDRSRST